MIDVRPLLRISIRFPRSYQAEQTGTEQRRYFLVYLVDNSSPKPYLVQRIWFDLSTENDVVVRRHYDRSGSLESDTRYSNYQFVPGGLRVSLSVDLQFPPHRTISRSPFRTRRRGLQSRKFRTTSSAGSPSRSEGVQI